MKTILQWIFGKDKPEYTREQAFMLTLAEDLVGSHVVVDTGGGEYENAKITGVVGLHGVNAVRFHTSISNWDIYKTFDEVKRTHFDLLSKREDSK